MKCWRQVELLARGHALGSDRVKAGLCGRDAIVSDRFGPDCGFNRTIPLHHVIAQLTKDHVITGTARNVVIAKAVLKARDVASLDIKAVV